MNVIIDFYPSRMYAAGCRASYSYGYVSILTSAGQAIQSNYFVYDTNPSNFVHFDSLAAGTYTIKFQMSKWDTNAVHDFDIRVYGSQAVTLSVPTP